MCESGNCETCESSYECCDWGNCQGEPVTCVSCGKIGCADCVNNYTDENSELGIIFICDKCYNAKVLKECQK